MAFQSFTDIRANEPDAHVMAMREYACEQALEANARSRAGNPEITAEMRAAVDVGMKPDPVYGFNRWRDASWHSVSRDFNTDGLGSV